MMKTFKTNMQPEVFDEYETKERRFDKIYLSIAITMLLGSIAKIIHIIYF